MPIYRVEGVTTSSGVPTVVHVHATTEAEARNGVVRFGVRSQAVTRVSVADLPGDAEVLDARSPEPADTDARMQDLVRRLAHSNLINHPIKTIACGTFLGLMMVYLLVLLIALCFGGEFRMG